MKQRGNGQERGGISIEDNGRELKINEDILRCKIYAGNKESINLARCCFGEVASALLVV
jgi:hypothetical protein